ncbi:hypothetical protein HGB07_04870, partial [Candidatus Roizmanbacteria bacterium]|nr:hypothetical protein [Candidatus Roizmanbacteria bacterium]
VISDRECPANEYARTNSLPTAQVDFMINEQKNLLDVVNSLAPNIIITTVHRILKKTILDEYHGRLINLHYSLLPAFGGSIGSRSVKAAMDYKACFSGVTVHFVDETLDGGQPLVQIAVPVSKNDDQAEFMDIIFRAGCIALFIALSLLKNPSENISRYGRVLVIKDREVLINPSIDIPLEMNDEKFWQALKQ